MRPQVSLSRLCAYRLLPEGHYRVGSWSHIKEKFKAWEERRKRYYCWWESCLYPQPSAALDCHFWWQSELEECDKILRWMEEAPLLQRSCRLEKHSFSSAQNTHGSKCRVQLWLLRCWKACGLLGTASAWDKCSRDSFRFSFSFIRNQGSFLSAWKDEGITHWYFGCNLPLSWQLFINTPQNNTAWHSLQK